MGRGDREPIAGQGPAPPSRGLRPRTDAEDEIPQETPAVIPVVGLGASAGGLEAFKNFFQAMPPGSGIAFVLIQHLDPHHESMMAELLGRQTPLEVVEAEDGTEVEAEHVYLIPPSKYLALDGDTLRLTDPEPRRGQRMPIDFFFRSLAESRGDKAICAVLSGTGSDGTLGLKAVKEAGGMTMVQDPEDAQYEGMPRSAIDTDLVDVVLPAHEMPRTLVRFVRHPFFEVRRAEARPTDHEEDEVEHILLLLKQRRRHDYSTYKRGTVLRRIERRMGILHLEDVQQYRQRLEQDPGELEALSKDLLIRVTSFFRDPEAFETLKRQVVVPLCERATEEQPIRIWVPGAATGEEAYSLAMITFESLTEQKKKNCRIQIFATDVDADALEQARDGVYPETIEADVSPARLSRFFTREGDHFRIHQYVRESVTFAVQNVIADPPFSKVDLISCRNLLIYLVPDMQRSVMELFHFALNSGGYLFLGSAEGASNVSELFRPLHKRWRIFQRIPARRVPMLDPAPGRTRMLRRLSAPVRDTQPTPRELGERTLLNHFAPSGVLVDRDLDVIQFIGRTGRFLEPASGEPSRQLMPLAKEHLRTKLRAALHRVVREGADEAEARVASGPESETRIRVRPLEDGSDPALFLVAFDELPVSAVPPREAAEGDPEVERIIGQLESELSDTREDLNSTIEQLEAANEELRASNEEVMSMNEELQSTNEELETSKEELQSLNEELTTVNAQLQEKVLELEQLTGDLDNLLGNTDIAILFLDPELRIRRFTPSMRRLLRLRQSDVGRPVADIASELRNSTLIDDVEYVLATRAQRECEVESADGTTFLQRVLPYRKDDGRFEGVVATFIDISERKESERRLAEREWRLRLALDAGGMGTWYWTPATDASILDERLRQLMGIPPDSEVNGAGFFSRIHAEDAERVRSSVEDALETGGEYETEFRVVHPEGELRWLIARGRAVPADAGSGRDIIGVYYDVSDRKAQEEAVRVSEERFRLAAAAATDGIWDWDLLAKRTWCNDAYRKLYGRPPGGTAASRRWWAERIHEHDRSRVVASLDAALQGEASGWRSEYRFRCADGSWADVDDRALIARDESGRAVRILGTRRDMTDRTRLEESLLDNQHKLREQAELLQEADRRKNEFLAVLGHELRNPLAAVDSGLRILSEEGTEAEAESVREMMRGQLDQLARLLDDLLDLSRISRGKIELQRAPCDLSRVAARAIEAMRPMLDAAGVEIEMDAAEPAPISGDPQRLEQVVANLLSNAAKSMPDGGSVQVRVVERDEEVELVVRDGGKGFSPELRDRIFDPFVQGSEERSGLGLGLALVRQIVELHGGAVSAETHGKEPGATFRVRLPLAESDELDADLDEGGERDCAGRRVLIVDDNAEAAWALAMLLRRQNCVVETAFRGEEVLAAARRHRAEVILLDIGLPDVDGLEVARRVRRDPELREVRLIAVTGYGHDEARREIAAAGFDARCVKPVALPQLLPLITEGGEAVREGRKA